MSKSKSKDPQEIEYDTLLKIIEKKKFDRSNFYSCKTISKCWYSIYGSTAISKPNKII